MTALLRRISWALLGRVPRPIASRLRGLRRTFRAAPLVREPLRLVLDQRIADGAPRSYTLRSSGIRIALRRDRRDLEIFEEIFLDGGYASFPPAELEGGESLRVADLGGNIGLFGAWALGVAPAASIVSFEPDPANLALLRSTVQGSNWLHHGRWTIVDRAAGVRAATRRYALGHGPESRALGEGDAPDRGVPVQEVDVYPLLAECDFVKIDIEGGEWPLLGDPRLASLRATIALEYHGGPGCPGADPRASALALLARAGYSTRERQWRPELGLGSLTAFKAAARTPPVATRPDGRGARPNLGPVVDRSGTRAGLPFHQVVGLTRRRPQSPRRFAPSAVGGHKAVPPPGSWRGACPPRVTAANSTGSAGAHPSGRPGRSRDRGALHAPPSERGRCPPTAW